jgi:hypothetical protein
LSFRLLSLPRNVSGPHGATLRWNSELWDHEIARSLLGVDERFLAEGEMILVDVREVQQRRF